MLYHLQNGRGDERERMETDSYQLEMHNHMASMSQGWAGVIDTLTCSEMHLFQGTNGVHVLVPSMLAALGRIRPDCTVRSFQQLLQVISF